MKISRVLQRDKLNAEGLAPIRLVVSWEGKRLRLGTGCLVKPEHWDAKTQLVKVQPGTQHTTPSAGHGLPSIYAARLASACTPFYKFPRPTRLKTGASRNYPAPASQPRDTP